MYRYGTVFLGRNFLGCLAIVYGLLSAPRRSLRVTSAGLDYIYCGWPVRRGVASRQLPSRAIKCQREGRAARHMYRSRRGLPPGCRAVGLRRRSPPRGKSAQCGRAVVVLSLVSSIYVHLRSSVFGSMCWPTSRTLTVFGELLSRALKIGRSGIRSSIRRGTIITATEDMNPGHSTHPSCNLSAGPCCPRAVRRGQQRSTTVRPGRGYPQVSVQHLAR